MGRLSVPAGTDAQAAGPVGMGPAGLCPVGRPPSQVMLMKVVREGPSLGAGQACPFPFE